MLLKNMRASTTYILAITLFGSSLAWQSIAQAQNDLFPNLQTNTQTGDNSKKSNTNGGPVTIDETGSGSTLPFTPVATLGGDLFPNNPSNPVNNGNANNGNRPGTSTNVGIGVAPSTGQNNNVVSPPLVNNNNSSAGIIIRTANVPSQYACPLFENSSSQDLNIAIDSLTNAIQGISDQCKSSQAQVDSVKQTTETIRSSVAALQAYVQDPSNSYTNMAQMQTNVNTLISGIDRMSDVFKNVTTSSDICGRKDLSWGKVALQLNNVVNAASPFLLLLTATQPMISLAVKGAIMGTVVGSNVINSMAQVIQSNTVKISDADQRNAILQNVCQFTKVQKKIDYIQLAQSGRFDQLKDQLKNGVNTYALKITGGDTLLNTMWSVRSNFMDNLGGFQSDVRKEREALQEVTQNIKEAQNNAYLICLRGKELVQMAQDNTQFPSTVVKSVSDAYQQNNYYKNIDTSDLQIIYGQPRMSLRDDNDDKIKKKVQMLITTYQNLLNRIARFPDNPVGDDVAACAATTMAFVQQVGTMITETNDIVTTDLDTMEDDLSKNEDYRKWKAQFEKITAEQENTNRMARVLSELTKAGSGVYNRSEFAEAAANLKRSLLGPRSGFLSGQSPVYAWLDYKRQRFAESKSDFEKSMRNIVARAFMLTKTGQGYAGTAPHMETAQEMISDVRLSQNLAILNKTTLPANSQQLELACIDLLKAVKDYSDSLDHLGATHFMCDMIWDSLDNSVDPKIVNYCRGQADYTGKQALRQKSYIEQANYELSAKPNANSLSMQDQATLVAKKMIEIGCRLPTAGQ
jgi:hypothetical protein